MECLITHPSVVRCLFDYVYIALQGQGKIIIADAPVQNCLFDVLLQKSGYGELFRNLAGKSSDKLVVDIADLRDIVLTGKGGIQRQSERRQKRYNGKVVDLKSSSIMFFNAAVYPAILWVLGLGMLITTSASNRASLMQYSFFPLI